MADERPLAQVAPRADEHEKAKDKLPERPRGPHPYPMRVQVAGASRPGDIEARELLASWFAEFAPMVEAVVARTVRLGDQGLVEDLAQDVWVEAWQYLLRGNEVERPAGLLAMKARRRVYAHYRLARVQRESVTDFQDEAAVVRLASWIGAAA
ncbi:RNA polymerase sigma factor [Streptomyces sp. NRRL WC-3795]|uniref:RNA polymerase sigma factor n=1 Tax=Streptomyces sp. NRRL WC-3795 TaxID=1463938 RepID=UPI00131A6E7B|nr:sigma factor [Streptomyces sp. NRRL WC-3795]